MPTELAQELAELVVALPLTLHKDHPGVILDADGHDTLVVDGRFGDEVAAAIAQLIVTAVNDHAGLPVEDIVPTLTGGTD